jgi:hypothetical protein
MTSVKWRLLGTVTVMAAFIVLVEGRALPASPSGQTVLTSG